MNSKIVKALQKSKEAQEKDAKIRAEFREILVQQAKKFEKHTEKYQHSLKNPHKP